MSYAGLDWSGTPFPKEKGASQNFYVPCCVWMKEAAVVDSYFTAWRRESGRPVTYEYHGYQCSGDVLLRAAEYVAANGCVAAALFDKQVLADELGTQVFHHPKRLPPGDRAIGTGHDARQQIAAAGLV